MSTNHHTAITSGAAANAATFNAPLGQLDAALSALLLAALQEAQINGSAQSGATKLNFAGAGLSGSYDSVSKTLTITVSGTAGTGSAHEIQEDGVAETVHGRLNFLTAGGLVVSNNVGNDSNDVGFSMVGAITGLSADTAPAASDILVVVQDPSGTALAQKMTLADVLKVIGGLTATTAPAAADELAIVQSGTTKRVTLANLLQMTAAYASTANTETLGGTKTLVDGDAALQFLDPGGSGRTVNLPTAGAANHAYLIVNTADAGEDLTVMSGATLVTTVGRDQATLLVSNGTTWRALSSGGAGGGADLVEVWAFS
jgi:hypothetical protein